MKSRCDKSFILIACSSCSSYMQQLVKYMDGVTVWRKLCHAPMGMDEALSKHSKC